MHTVCQTGISCRRLKIKALFLDGVWAEKLASNKLLHSWLEGVAVDRGPSNDWRKSSSGATFLAGLYEKQMGSTSLTRSPKFAHLST